VHTFAFLALALPLAAPALKEKSPKGPGLVGEWVGERLVSGGFEDPAAPTLRYQFTRDGKWPGTRNGTRLGGPSRSYTLDLKPDPPAIDLVYDEGRGDAGKYLGIFRLEGDRLTICFAQENGPRPRSFEPSDGVTLVVLKRLRE
jgi:uncharacterized protein (TIGR03067 family)